MRELFTILPSQSLESLSFDQESQDADEILTAWTAAYHPEVLRRTRELARPLYGLYIYDEPCDAVLVLPAATEAILSGDWLERAESRNCRILRDLSSVEKLVQDILENLDADELSATPDAVESPEVEDFLALGTTHLLSELLAHRLQYMSYLDDSGFKKTILDALDAKLAGDADQARRNMQNAWDMLIQSRQYYAPSDGFLFDLTLLTSSVLSANWLEEWREEKHLNLLLDGQTARKMTVEFPQLATLLREKRTAKEVSLVGGEFRETDLPLLTHEGILARLKNGLASFEKTLGLRPDFFGRRRFGLTPILPGILKGLGYEGVLYTAFDEGVFPIGSQSRIGWQGLDKTGVESIAKIPTDAKKTLSVCELPGKIAETLNTDNAFGAMFAHWPGKDAVSPWYRRLLRAANWVPLFGTPSTFAECLEATQYSASDERWQPDEFFSPYLQQAVRDGCRDPISRWMKYHQLRVFLEAVGSLEVLAAWLGGKNNVSETPSQNLLSEMDASEEPTPEFFAAARVQAESLRKKAAGAISEKLSTSKKAPNAVLSVNPWSFAVTHAVGKETVCVPAMGFAVTPEKKDVAEPAPKRSFWSMFRSEKPLPSPAYFDRESNTWRMLNEHLDLRFDAFTGHLRAVYDNEHRGNRFSQQLGMRLAPSPYDSLDDDDSGRYSIQAADKIETKLSDDRSELHVSGRLMDRQGEILSLFTQITTLRRGSRILEFDVYLEPKKFPGKNPWQSYYANRLIWGDTVSDLFRNVGFDRVRTTRHRIEAPLFLDICPLKINSTQRFVSSVTQTLAERVKGERLKEEDFLPQRDDTDLEYTDTRLTLLANGLPYHRFLGHRKIDTLLLVHGETCRRFRYGISVDAPYPMQSVLRFMAPPVDVGIYKTEATASWFGHVSHRNVLLTHLVPTAKGARVRFAETEGRAVSVKFQTFRDLRVANRVDFLGQNLHALSLENGAVRFDIPAFGFLEMEVEF